MNKGDGGIILVWWLEEEEWRRLCLIDLLTMVGWSVGRLTFS